MWTREGEESWRISSKHRTGGATARGVLGDDKFQEHPTVHCGWCKAAPGVRLGRMSLIGLARVTCPPSGRTGEDRKVWVEEAWGPFAWRQRVWDLLYHRVAWGERSMWGEEKEGARRNRTSK